MGLIRRYQWYKFLFQITLILNVLFTCLGVVAMVRWLQSHDPTNLEMAAIGLGVLFFGIILPAYLFHESAKKMIEMKKRTEVLVTEYISQWMQSFEDYEDEEPLKNPKFWLNMTLLLFETIGDNSKNLGLQILAEMSPMLRKEMKSRTPVKTKKKKVIHADE